MPTKTRGRGKVHDQRPQTPFGLRNQGATCYLNSVLQVLFMTPDFRKAVTRHSAPESMDHHLSVLFKNLEKRTSKTEKITRELKIAVNRQRDAAEFFERILGLTSQEASAIFSGQLSPKSKCLRCEKETSSNQPFWHLPVPLVRSDDQVYRVVNGIREFFSESHVTGENQIYCQHCQEKTDSTVKIGMRHHPAVLTLFLKRFYFDYLKRTFIKNQQSVEVPFRLTVENKKYELYAFVEHFGTLTSGHYTATIKSQDEEKWFRYNDANVTLVEDSSFQSKNPQSSKSAYLLFYKGTETDDISSGNAENVDASPPGDLTEIPVRRRNTVEKSRLEDVSVENDEKKSNHATQSDVGHQDTITQEKHKYRNDNVDKLSDDGNGVTNVTVGDQKEASKGCVSSNDKNGEKCGQTSSTEILRRSKKRSASRNKGAEEPADPDAKPINEREEVHSGQQCLGNEVSSPTVSTVNVPIWYRFSTREDGGKIGSRVGGSLVEEALSRAKERDTMKPRTEDQIKSFEGHETHSNTTETKDPETKDRPDPEETRPPRSDDVTALEKGLAKFSDHDLSSKKSSVQSHHPPTVDTQAAQIGFLEYPQVECPEEIGQIREDRNTQDKSQASFQKQPLERKGLTEKKTDSEEQLQPGDSGKAELELQPSIGSAEGGDGPNPQSPADRANGVQLAQSENLSGSPSPGLHEQTLGNQKSPPEADVKTGCAAGQETVSVGDKKRKKGRKFKGHTFSFGLSAHRLL